jgi:hypothetical protein
MEMLVHVITTFSYNFPIFLNNRVPHATISMGNQCLNNKRKQKQEMRILHTNYCTSSVES